MKIALEYSYPLARKWYRFTLSSDPCGFASFRAMEVMAEMGHEAHAIVPATDVTRDEDEVIRGVHYHFMYGLHPLKDKLVQYGPWDTVLLNSDPTLLKHLFVNAPRPRRVIQRYHSDAFYFQPMVLGCIDNQPDIAVGCKPSDASMLAFMGVTCQTDCIPCGVNSDACKAHRMPWDKRPFDICFSATGPHKGPEYCKAVAEECVKLGLRMLPHGGWIFDFHKPHLYEMLGQQKFMFHPSLLEGASRLLAEAHFCGVRIICAVESAAVLSNCGFLNSIAVMTGGRCHPPFRPVYSRPPAEVAKDIQACINRYTTEAEPNPLDYYATADYEIKRLIEMATT